LPVAPFMDREKVTKPTAQIGFIKFVLLPMFETIAKVMYSLLYLIYTLSLNIRELRCTDLYLEFNIASTTATSIVHSKLDYCNSLNYSLLRSQFNPLQQIQNSELMAT